MEISDNYIVEQVRQGDVEAYAELVERYQKCIFNLMYRFSYTKGDAAELTQDVFCKAYEKLNSFQNNRTFFPWLYTLAINHGREWSRKQERKKNGPYKDIFDVCERVDSGACNKSALETLINRMR